MRGVIKHWNGRGYGFIKPDTGGDVFCHISAVRDQHYLGAGVPVGSIVEFEVEPGQRGPQAVGVRVISEPSELVR